MNKHVTTEIHKYVLHCHTSLTCFVAEGLLSFVVLCAVLTLHTAYNLYQNNITCIKMAGTFAKLV